MGLFGIENQQDQKITLIQNGVPRIGLAANLEPKIKICKMYHKRSIYIEFDPLNNSLAFVN